MSYILDALQKSEQERQLIPFRNGVVSGCNQSRRADGDLPRNERIIDRTLVERLIELIGRLETQNRRYTFSSKTKLRHVPGKGKAHGLLPVGII